MRAGDEPAIGPISGASFCYTAASASSAVTAKADAPRPVTRGRGRVAKAVFKLAKGVMPCLLLPCIAALAACNPPPKEAAMRNPSSAAPSPTGRGAGDRAQAAQGSLPEPVSAAENPAPAPRADSPAEAQGRRTLSTAFVRVGPDGHLTVELRNGRAMVLRDVVMRPRDFCGVQVLGGSAGTRYCGGYGDIAAARPGGAAGSRRPRSSDFSIRSSRGAAPPSANSRHLSVGCRLPDGLASRG